MKMMRILALALAVVGLGGCHSKEGKPATEPMQQPSPQDGKKPLSGGPGSSQVGSESIATQNGRAGSTAVHPELREAAPEEGSLGQSMH